MENSLLRNPSGDQAKDLGALFKYRQHGDVVTGEDEIGLFDRHLGLDRDDR